MSANVCVSSQQGNVVVEPSAATIIIDDTAGNVILTGSQSTTLLGGTGQPVTLGATEANLCIAPYSTITIETNNTNFLTTEAIASEVIPAFVVVEADPGGLFVASNDIAAHRDRVAGISLNSAGIGETVTILTFGTYTYTGWSFDSTKGIYLGVNGAIIQDENLPAQEFSVRLGDVRNPTTIFLDIETPIEILI